MKIYPYLRQDSAYNKDDRVNGYVYEISDNFGAFVAVDDIYSGLIPKKELYGNINVGDRISARVTEIKEDGKLSLSVREKAYLHNVGVLFNGARFAKVAELRSLIFRARLNRAVKLRQRNNRNVQLLGQLLE